MENSFWQARMAENHLSNLLKKTLESEIAAFGFPVIPQEYHGAEKGVLNGNGQAAEMNCEQLFRTKLLELERQTQEIEKEAYGKGFAQGEKDGYEYGHKAAQVIRTQLERIAENMEALPAKVLQDYREWLIRSSIRIAERIINREVQTSPEIVADAVKALLDEAEEHSTLTAYLNPNDLELIEKRADLTLCSNKKHFALKADRSLERGGCRVESAVQLLDASLASMCENLEKYLLDGAAPRSATGEADGE
jgi:flagellar assembly protein FliH